MTNFNERTNALLYKDIPLTFYSRKGWCWFCVRGELERGTDCYILTQSSSDYSSISFAFWLGCSTMGHWGPKPSVWGWFSLRWNPLSYWNCNWNSNWPKPSVAPGYIIVWHPSASPKRTHLSPSPNSTTSTGQGDIPISSTGCTCFAVLPLIYTGVPLDWRLGRGSICYNISIGIASTQLNGFNYCSLKIIILFNINQLFADNEVAILLQFTTCYSIKHYSFICTK